MAVGGRRDLKGMEKAEQMEGERTEGEERGGGERDKGERKGRGSKERGCDGWVRVEREKENVIYVYQGPNAVQTHCMCVLTFVLMK